jgi:hypothetical protein
VSVRLTPHVNYTERTSAKPQVGRRKEARPFFRILFAPEGRYGQVLLALEGLAKKTRKTPP